jgi:hypothetical protein
MSSALAFVNHVIPRLVFIGEYLSTVQNRVAFMLHGSGSSALDAQRVRIRSGEVINLLHPLPEVQLFCLKPATGTGMSRRLRRGNRGNAKAVVRWHQSGAGRSVMTAALATLASSLGNSRWSRSFLHSTLSSAFMSRVFQNCHRLNGFRSVQQERELQ